MTWIFVMMGLMIGGSVLSEWVLPAKAKEPLGVAACWMMMSITMTFLGLCTTLLALVITDAYIYDFSWLSL